MIRFLLSMTLLCMIQFGHAQKNADSSWVNADSIEKELDDFLAIYSNKNKSYLHASVSLNNTQLSVNNVALNAQQLNPGLTLSPSIEYFHKLGLSISYNNFLLINGNNSGIVQHSINSGYTYSKNKKFDFGIFYTHFINNPSLSQYASPYKHDFYAYATYNHLFIQPSMAIGYSTGNYREIIKRNEQLVIARPFRGDTTINFEITDSLSIRLQDFSNILSFRKRFLIESNKARKYFVFTPSIMMLFIKNDYEVEYISYSEFSPRTQIFLQNQPRFAEIFRRELSRQFPGLNETRGFLNSGNYTLQSLGINLDFSAYYGKFYVNPRIYFDYYLLSSENKFNAFFSLQTGILIN